MAEWLDFKAIKEQVSFETLLASYQVALRGTGDQRSALCPLHRETKPSFKVNLGKKAFHCFGCGAKGNVLDFVAQMEHVELKEAARIVAERCGLAVEGRANGPKRAVAGREAAKRPEPLPEPQTRTVAAPGTPDEPVNPALTFELKLDPSHPYLAERGLTPELIAEFGLGYCARGMMKGRICIPIHDEAGRLVAYAGRFVGEEADLPADEGKYKLPPKFQKSRVLWNLHRLDDVLEHVVVVEGYFGAIRLHALGAPVVALMGTSISEHQLELLRGRGCDRLTLMLDGDKPGRNATAAMLPELAEWFFVHVATLPDGAQPDTVAEAVLRELVELPR